MNAPVKLTSTPLRALLLCGCMAVLLAATAHASVMDIPATTTGWVSKYPSGYDKGYGVLSYARAFYHGDIFGSAFLKFDLAALPDTCLLISADLNYYQYTHLNADPTTSLKLIPDPVPPGAQELFSLIELAPALCPSELSSDGWVSRPFNAGALSALDSCLEAGSVSFGIREEGDIEAQGNAYGYDGELPPFLRIVYIGPESDIQAVRGELATYPQIAGASDTAVLVLTNRGLRTSDYFWAYARSSGHAPESTLVGEIAVGETVSVRLPLATSGSANTFVDYRLWAACPNDPWRANDTTQLRCWTFPASTYAAEGFDKPGFPPTDWAILDNDSGNRCWQRCSDDSVVHSGAGFAMCVHELTGPNDDWLISGPVCPRTDEPDSLGFCFRAYLASPPLYLQTWAMRGLGIADTIHSLTSGSVSDGIYHRRSVSLDEFDGDTIHIGFRCQSSGDWNGLCIDDVWFSRGRVPGTHEPAVRSPCRLTLRLTPNPATGRFVTARYNLAAGTRGTLTLRDVLGRTAKSFMLDPSGTTRLDLRGFAPGVYMATLEAVGQSVSRKFVLTTP